MKKSVKLVFIYFYLKFHAVIFPVSTQIIFVEGKLYDALATRKIRSGHIFTHSKFLILLKGKYHLSICILPYANNIFFVLNAIYFTNTYNGKYNYTNSQSNACNSLYQFLFAQFLLPPFQLLC